LKQLLIATHFTKDSLYEVVTKKCDDGLPIYVEFKNGDKAYGILEYQRWPNNNCELRCGIYSDGKWTPLINGDAVYER
jgi:hypothetical protein